ncbi:MAG: OmpA/MotB domain protein [Verrucomicrobia bacterium]|nr:OmpA/MotB domain protein [Verrucomicrobiota bacterium]
MNIASKKLCLVLASAVFVLAGCKKKPVRPDPSSTVLGPTGGGTVNPETVNPALDPTAQGLTQRTDGVFEDDQMIKGLLKPVYFDFDKSNVKESERARIKEAKDYLEKNPQHRILFEGHCDWRGTDEYNLSLGDRRATAAKKYLISLGVAADKVEANSKGSLEASKNADDATRAKDRRAEIIILKK